MPFQFTHPDWLWALPLAAGWVWWWFRRSEIAASPLRRRLALGLRLGVVTALVLAPAGLQWRQPREGLNVFFLLDRSDSVPAAQQERALEYVNEVARGKRREDRGGVIVFGNGAAIEFTPNVRLDVQKIHAVIGTERTDIASAIRLGTAAFPETGQKRLVLLSDGNENVGDALAAVAAARALGVTVDVAPLGAQRRGDVAVQKVGIPSRLKVGQTFEVGLFIQVDTNRAATLRLFQNDRFLGEQPVELAPGKNLYTFPQTLPEPGFYSYEVQVDVPGDAVPQNNRAANFASVRGEPRVLVVSTDPAADAPLADALRATKLDVRLADLGGFPGALAELQSYDALFLCNVAAGDLGDTALNLLESAVRDFGVGLVCVGGDQTYAAGGYRGTPLETVLPVDMELSSKKVLPSGAVVLIMHGMEFNNGNQVARECALGVLDALGPQDEMGVVLWDGSERWLFPLSPVGDRKEKGRQIAGMNQGDLPSFQGVMERAYHDPNQPNLKQSRANLKHIIVFSDGDPAPPGDDLMQAIVNDRITVSTVLIAGHAGPETMIRIADLGRGRFYDVRDPAQLPQIFLKEAMVILKSAIYEEPFQPVLTAPTEPVRGIPAGEFPTLRGYVATTAKPRAEVPLVSDKGDPVLAHWQFGLGRAVAFTSDARAKWAQDWLGWPRYRPFWAQVAQWALRRLDAADFNTEVTVDTAGGIVSVEALDAEGNYRNFLNLLAVVVSPRGERQTVRLEQTGPGRYEARFATREVGTYLLNLQEIQDGQVRATQSVGASVNYSPEFAEAGPNLNLLRRIAELGGGKLLPPPGMPPGTDHPFLHDRLKTFQPHDLWPWLLQLGIVLFVADVGVRRIYLDRAEWLAATANLRRLLRLGRPSAPLTPAEEPLNALLARHNQVRAQRTGAGTPSPPLFQPTRPPPTPAAPAQPPAPAGEVSPSSPPGPPAETAPSRPDRTAVTSRLLEAKRRAAKKLDQS